MVDKPRAPASGHIVLVQGDVKVMTERPQSREQAVLTARAEFSLPNSWDLSPVRLIFAMLWQGEYVIVGRHGFGSLKDGDEVFLEVTDYDDPARGQAETLQKLQQRAQQKSAMT
jgi:hypothetical protein